MDYKIEKSFLAPACNVVTLDVPNGMRLMNSDHTTVQIEVEAGKEMELVQHIQAWLSRHIPLILETQKARGQELARKKEEALARQRAAFPPPVPHVDLSQRNAAVPKEGAPVGPDGKVYTTRTEDYTLSHMGKSEAIAANIVRDAEENPSLD